MTKTDRRVRIGVLGCGPIAQFAHLDAARKARNADLHAICDRAPDLVERMAAVHRPRASYRDYDAMLADPEVEAVIVATADAFHVDASMKAIDAGKHVLVEKPLGVAIEACEALRERVDASGLVLRVGHNRRFDPGIAFACRFLREEVGEITAIKAWYHDSTHRYSMTDNLQPIPVLSPDALRPGDDPKADRRRYFLLTHGSHLVDTARNLAGPIDWVRARHRAHAGGHTWFVEVGFASGALGHLDLSVPIRGDFSEGFHAFGEGGSVSGRAHLPWFRKAADVECFYETDRTYRRPLGEDGDSYRRQVEDFASAILDGGPSIGADAEDGTAAVRALVAIARSVEDGGPVRLEHARGSV